MVQVFVTELAVDALVVVTVAVVVEAEVEVHVLERVADYAAIEVAVPGNCSSALQGPGGTQVMAFSLPGLFAAAPGAARSTMMGRRWLVVESVVVGVMMAESKESLQAESTDESRKSEFPPLAGG